ncbi:hypothetical protein GF391_03855|nr:hypothetical protein [Candidatus Uhrbacteria bacterium]
MKRIDDRRYEVVIDGPDDPKVDTKRGLGDGKEAPSDAESTSNNVPVAVPSIQKTFQFVLTGRVKVETQDVPESRRGRFRAKTFLGLGDSAPPPSSGTRLPKTLDEARSAARLSEIPPAPEPEQESLAVKQAKLALLRTMNFLDFLIVNSPPSERASLEERKANLVVPKHLPEDDEIYRMEYFARTFGYYGPVLWFIPPLMTLHDLVSAGLLSETWWRKEPNFPEGFTTLSPFDPPPDAGKEYREPGYWALAIPGPTPGTTAKTFAEQEACLPDIARMYGLRVINGCIDPSHRMIMAVRGIVDTLYLCAIAKHSHELVSEIPQIARTANVIRSYHEGETQKGIVVPKHSLFSNCRACAEFSPRHKLCISDMVDDRASQGVGLIVFVIPKIYS